LVVEKLGEMSMRKFHEQYIVDENGQKTAVILPFEEYEELLEDLHDLAFIAERRDEPIIAFEELKKRLKEDGLL
jgi:Phd_YefM.